ncbi:MAG: RnfABCDGE type electron transport complex subunit D [Clostridia bacterium]|nr:RnfABCDGE type electron transport complex subunit D [Clostridia bacterium]
MNTDVMNLSSAPHLRDRWTTPFIMRVVFLSLLPATVVGIVVHGWQAAAIIVLSIVSAVLSEAIFDKICRKPLTIWDGSAVITGLLLALSLSPSTPLYIPVIGSVFAIVVVKCFFGGLGKNFINPALAGRCFLLISFGRAMTTFAVDGISSATPVAELAEGNLVDLTSMFLGTSNAVIGSSILALLAGGLLLWSLDIIHGQICFSVLGAFTVYLGLFGGKGFDPLFLAAHLCGGGVVMGAFFMATDYVTSPVSRLGQFIYGSVIGILGAMFRVHGSSADSFSYSIIIGNLLTPLIDTYIVQKPFAYRRNALRGLNTDKRPFWQRIPKPVIALLLITTLAGLALSGVFTVTKDTIEEQEEAARLASYKQVCPDAETFEDIPAAQEAIAQLAGGTYGTSFGRATVNQASAGKTASGELAGYVLSVTSADGFDGNITLTLGLTPEGAVTGISFTQISETPGMGMQANEDGFRSQFTGKSTVLKMVKGDASADNEISAISGASITSRAVTNAVSAGIDFWQNIIREAK